MATDVCDQTHETNNKLCNGMSRVTISIQPDEQDQLDIVSLSDRVYPTFREEVRNFLQAIDVNDGFDETLEIEKAERWLEWANRFKYLKIVTTDIPDFILPNNCSGKLIDVKVFCKRGPDDHIYDTYKMVRDRVARGNSFLQITRGPHRGTRCVLHALKKFTGGLGDDDDKDKGDNTTWRNYFIKPMDKTRSVIATRKANGEAAHLSCVQIDKQFLICSGSKNVHMLIRNRGDIAAYKGDRYRIAAEVSDTVIDFLEAMEPAKKQKLLHFLAVTRLTAVFEILSPLHQHVEDLSYLDGPILQFIAWTSTDLEPAVKHQLCAVAPHIGIEIARALGLSTVKYESLKPDQLTEKMTEIRQGYQYEGEVLYFLDADNTVIGMLKKKTAWYILCRAIREKVRNSAASIIKKKSTFSMSKSVQQIEKRLTEIQSWLGLSEQTISQWKKVGTAFLKWSIHGLEQGHLSMADIADQFPIIWKRHLAESGLSDDIKVECSLESLDSSADNLTRLSADNSLSSSESLD